MEKFDWINKRFILQSDLNVNSVIIPSTSTPKYLQYQRNKIWLKQWIIEEKLSMNCHSNDLVLIRSSQVGHNYLDRMLT